MALLNTINIVLETNLEGNGATLSLSCSKNLPLRDRAKRRPCGLIIFQINFKTE